MAEKDPRIDVYIEKSAPFARPILKHLRKIIHGTCPEVKETIKWGFASFDYKGPFVSMAAFKEHAVFGFWKYALMSDPEGYLDERKNNGGAAMGNLGRITSMKDLPPDSVIRSFLLQAKKLNDNGVKLPPRKKSTAPQTITIPDILAAALRKAKLTAKFNGMSYAHRKEYVQWIMEAKKEETRLRRVNTTVEWISEGKGRNWKYEKAG